MINRIGFEYRNRKGETVFETFLKYTDEKKKSSAMLGKILKRLLDRDGMTFLDVGSGNGEYLRLSLDQIQPLKKVKLTLLEPSEDLVKRLRLTAKNFPLSATAEIVHSTFDDFATSNRFDVILASHLPFVKRKLLRIFEKMLDLLRPDGCLIVVLRKKDDVHEFRTTFKSRLMNEDYQSLTIDDALEIFYEFAKIRSLKILTFSANSELRLPLTDNMRDVISIIEFLLNKRWEKFPIDAREAILNHINQKKGIFHQIDGFAVAKKISPPCQIKF